MEGRGVGKASLGRGVGKGSQISVGFGVGSAPPSPVGFGVGSLSSGVGRRVGREDGFSSQGGCVSSPIGAREGGLVLLLSPNTIF